MARRKEKRRAQKRCWRKYTFRSLFSLLVIFVFSYGVLVNQTISVAAQNEALQQEINEKGSLLTEITTSLAQAEGEFKQDNLIGASLFSEGRITYVERADTSTLTINARN